MPDYSPTLNPEGPALHALLHRIYAAETHAALIALVPDLLAVPGGAREFEFAEQWVTRWVDIDPHEDIPDGLWPD